MAARAFLQLGYEPDLSELLADPIFHLIMRRDGVSMESLLSLLGRSINPLLPQAEKPQKTAEPAVELESVA